MTPGADENPLDVALDNAEGFSAQIGVLISCFALLEGYVPKLISLLLSISDDDAFVIAGSFNSFSHRIDLLENLMKIHKGDKDIRAVIKIFIPRFREATKIRNKFAHAEYSFMTAEKFTIKSYQSSASKKTVSKIHFLDDVKQDTYLIKNFINDLHGYIYRREAPSN